MAEILLFDADWELVPERLQEPLARYLQHGAVPGSFLVALLSNNLERVIVHADHAMLHRLPDIVRFLINYAPRAAWGSGEAIARWEMMGGTAGLSVHAEVD